MIRNSHDERRGECPTPLCRWRREHIQAFGLGGSEHALDTSKLRHEGVGGVRFVIHVVHVKSAQHPNLCLPRVGSSTGGELCTAGRIPAFRRQRGFALFAQMQRVKLVG